MREGRLHRTDDAVEDEGAQGRKCGSAIGVIVGVNVQRAAVRGLQVDEETRDEGRCYTAVHLLVRDRDTTSEERERGNAETHGSVKVETLLAPCRGVSI